MGKTTRLVLVAIWGWVMGEGIATAAPASAAIPPSLRPWAVWVLDGDEGRNARCPAHAGESSPACAWPSRLGLGLGERQGTFRQEWTMFAAGFVALPGDKEHWPRDVRVDGHAVPTVDHDGEAQVELRPGRHRVTGGFVWDSLPESLMVPAETGLISLQVRGKAVGFPMRESDGRLFLGKAEEKIEEEKVDLSVYRKLGDAVPQLLTTRLELAVAGKSREVLLARPLPDGFEPRKVEGDLPLRFESDGRVRMQVRPGLWTIEIVAHRVSATNHVRRPVPDGLWQTGDEIWVFEAAPNVRAVTVADAATIDTAQTLLPASWKSLPAYAMAPGATLTLVEQRRGDREPAPERLTLDRTLWLDASGAGFSVRDRIGGELTRSWRVEASPGMHLGRVAVEGDDRFITRTGPEGREGVELRRPRAVIEADGRIDRHGPAMLATGFAHDFDQLAATLNLPLGWDLLHATGVDRVSGSWVGRWSLGQVFLLLVLVLAITRLYGIAAGALAVPALGLSLVDARAPALSWLLVIAVELAVRASQQRLVLVAARVARPAIWIVVAVTTWPFFFDEIRFALHPASVADRGMRAGGDDGSRYVLFMAKSPEPAGETVLGGLAGGSLGEAYGLGGVGLLGSAPGELHAISGRDGAGARHKGDEGSMGGYGRRLEKPKEGLYGLKGPKDNPDPQLAKRLAEYDRSIVVQTGEGLPRRWWRSATLAFSGPVKSDHEVRLYLVPPWLARTLAAGQVGLLLGLAWLLVRRRLRLRAGLLPPRPIVGGLVALVLLGPLAARAEAYPPEQLLKALQERLLRQPDCAPDCAALGDLALDVTPGWLSARLQASAAMPTAIALPGALASWSPTEVRVDGMPAAALARGGDGQLWLALEAGRFTVEVAGPLPGRDSIQIPLPMRPHRATFSARGFELSGIHEDGAVDESISLSRIASSVGPNSDLAEASRTLPPFLHVERTLKLGLKWEVETRVTRETPQGAPLVVAIPLLPGESVTSAGIRTEKTRPAVSLSFASDELVKSWRSTLAERAVIELRADPATAGRWSETWRAEIGPIWHATFSGIPAVRPEMPAISRTPEWRPWPGEEVRIAIDKPSGVSGRTLTIDASTLDVEPGLHGTRMTLVLELRSSRGTDHRIALPAGAVVSSVRRADQPQPIRQDGQELMLSVPAGRHGITVAWRQPVDVTALFRTPAVDLRAPSTNSRVNVSLAPASRWLLWIGGPADGPTVGFWAVVALLIVASVLLARTRLTPLRMHHWLLLGLGLTQTTPLAALVVVGCLLGLGWRARRAPSDARPVLYDCGQVALALSLVLSLYALASVVDLRLGQPPEMFVSGNDSAPGQLAWYQDRSGPTLAQPALLSLPLWTYRGLVMAWALWLAIAVIRWSPWIGSCLKRHGLWRSWAKPLRVP